MIASSRLAAVFAAAALSIGALAGCGGSSDAPASGDPAMSLEQFVTQVNAVCADAEARSDALAVPTDAADVDGFLIEQINIAKNTADAVAALPAPPEIASSVETMVTTWGEIVALLTTAQDNITAGEDPLAALSGLGTEGPALAATVTAAATEAGLTECAK